VFTRDAHQLKVPELAASLAQFVYDHRAANRSFEWHDGLPPGYLHIGVFPRHAIEPPERYSTSGLPRKIDVSTSIAGKHLKSGYFSLTTCFSGRAKSRCAPMTSRSGRFRRNLIACSCSSVSLAARAW
jgi:hypothetical protein